MYFLVDTTYRYGTIPLEVTKLNPSVE
jgi:hypothetical protein